MKKKIIFVILGLTIVLAVLFLVYPTRQADDITNPAGKTLIRPQTGKFVPERAGYYETVWPSEHTDLWRSHAALGAGLSANFAPEQLTVVTARLNLPSWGYTRAKDEVFVIGGSPFVLNSFTQAIKNGQPLSGLASIGSTIRDVFNTTSPYVARVNPITM